MTKQQKQKFQEYKLILIDLINNNKSVKKQLYKNEDLQKELSTSKLTVGQYVIKKLQEYVNNVPEFFTYETKAKVIYNTFCQDTGRFIISKKTCNAVKKFCLLYKKLMHRITSNFY